MRVMVTGGRGFVGTRLCARLAREGHFVSEHDLDLDVADAAAVEAAVGQVRPDAIIHLAAISFIPASFDDPALTYRVNYLGARSVLEAARLAPNGVRVLLVGSSAIYGPAAPEDPPFDETAPLRPNSPYGWTKAAADLLGGAYARRGLEVMRVRPFNHTGAGRPDIFVESSFARQVAEIEAGLREPRLHVGNLDAVRDFLHVEDVIEAYVRLLDPSVAAGVYNIATGRGVTIRALLDGLLSRSSVQAEIEQDPARWRPADANTGSSARLQRATGWKPERTLDDTLDELLADWRGRLANPSADRS